MHVTLKSEVIKTELNQFKPQSHIISAWIRSWEYLGKNAN